MMSFMGVPLGCIFSACPTLPHTSSFIHSSALSWQMDFLGKSNLSHHHHLTSVEHLLLGSGVPYQLLEHPGG